jgi:hypothetical protein
VQHTGGALAAEQAWRFAVQLWRPSHKQRALIKELQQRSPPCRCACLKFRKKRITPARAGHFSSMSSHAQEVRQGQVVSHRHNNWSLPP